MHPTKNSVKNYQKLKKSILKRICFLFFDIIYVTSSKLSTKQHNQGRSSRGAKGAKATFHILAKCCVFVAALSNEKRNFETPFELIIPYVKSRQFCSVT